ncbi:MAG TPA: hypothetical protein VHK01_19220 [Lacipirellulaceae bacterium]|jgi:hypothetical protein|nr:hypothetical protein [Lacipirellulaceae bacterium]
METCPGQEAGRARAPATVPVVALPEIDQAVPAAPVLDVPALVIDRAPGHGLVVDHLPAVADFRISAICKTFSIFRPAAGWVAQIDHRLDQAVRAQVSAVPR